MLEKKNIFNFVRNRRVRRIAEALTPEFLLNSQIFNPKDYKHDNRNHRKLHYFGFPKNGFVLGISSGYSLVSLIEALLYLMVIHQFWIVPVIYRRFLSFVSWLF